MECDKCMKEPEQAPPVLPSCVCPRDDHDIVVHEEHCLQYRNEQMVYRESPVCECYDTVPPATEEECACCRCPVDQCRCNRAGREAFDEWRSKRVMGAMPAVLEATHPLMQKFQETLKRFLEKENQIAADEIQRLKDELKQSKDAYDKDLETIYRDDHDTNAQRALIEEYEQTLAAKRAERLASEERVRVSTEKYKQARQKLDSNAVQEREATEELEALTTLCRQLEAWRDETESDLTVNQRMSEKMKTEKKALADEKRQLDMIIYNLSNEVWKLESKLELFQKQMEIKNAEMEQVNDKVTAYAAELEDLELDKRRLVSLWNSVLVNIQQRDRVYDSVRDDYKSLQENYRTLLNNLEISKKVAIEEMNRSKEIAMNKDKINYDIASASKYLEFEEVRRDALQTQIADITESIEMTERDQELVKSENQTMKNILRTTEKDLQHKTELKLKLENEILSNLQECLLNDKAVEAMANGIKKMREMSRKQEMTLTGMENQHAKIVLDIEMHRSRQAHNKRVLEECMNKVAAREKEIELLQEKYDRKTLLLTRKQRELDIMMKKYIALKEVFDMKSPQERRIQELEQQIRELRERTERAQHDWLRLQGHVVKLAAHHHKILADMNLINKQIQICDEKTMRIQAECERIAGERAAVERSLRMLRGRLEVAERTRKDATERNEDAQRAHAALTHEYTANLKDAESEIIELEEDIEALEKEKINLTQDLDRVQREALIWQRKGILAVELKRNIQSSKAAEGEIGQMKTEIHRMEVRRDQLRRTGEKLSEDLALYVTRRETAADKGRAAAALEKAHGGTQQSRSAHYHKLRLARADATRLNKELKEAQANMEYLENELCRLRRETVDTAALNSQLEEHVAALLRDCRDTERQKQWLLERVVRSQRLGSELATAVKRQILRVKKPKAAVIAEYTQAKALNESLKNIVATLSKEYPHLSDKLETISNTLDIYSPTQSPRLSEDQCYCPKDLENVAEKPLDSCPCP
ncbi:PREDICTED: coiled-coil domain-containing protein 40-like [Papilio xuthus]|uniref:Coiled-coil domain-containing protein 40-like n=1 Tax=Papilio xuthus TaxID=66420 RepID=A0AAJ6ZCM0_PAPXU|nr:PREDICTED: coiled-coil domain-containing protein 40-like [Papilio xuthus]